ncbi:transmembrane protein, putative (macronuclear) [Tetrahymena thermophila SB210]|uniref:Transmembrane protein, putative n=1 Tax=Tetrahymena thermophila (strain SB210) TaxID=312017 RepID=W7XLD1_TETTS|nr:transmembrane protein, putative [Tetrahymena thermophila SB210]EWS76079.1 transmembrane protein, putative [Tetrahymena thermophila SB210]|eukprot:XP_012651386.1 transmembrane protein, putative [Tetrahymena thermophila SB210]
MSKFTSEPLIFYPVNYCLNIFCIWNTVIYFVQASKINNQIKYKIQIFKYKITKVVCNSVHLSKLSLLLFLDNYFSSRKQIFSRIINIILKIQNNKKVSKQVSNLDKQTKKIKNFQSKIQFVFNKEIQIFNQIFNFYSQAFFSFILNQKKNQFKIKYLIFDKKLQFLHQKIKSLIKYLLFFYSISLLLNLLQKLFFISFNFLFILINNIFQSIKCIILTQEIIIQKQLKERIKQDIHIGLKILFAFKQTVVLKEAYLFSFFNQIIYIFGIYKNIKISQKALYQILKVKYQRQKNQFSKSSFQQLIKIIQQLYKFIFFSHIYNNKQIIISLCKVTSTYK